MSDRRGEIPKLDLKSHILREIKRIAAANSEVAPGVQLFERETGIKEHEWLGKYWSKWGDAVVDAGFSSNEFNKAYSDDFVLRAFARAVRDLHKIPTRGELQLYRKHTAGLPHVQVVYAKFGSKDGLLRRLREFCRETPEFVDLLVLLGDDPSPDGVEHERHEIVGFVYLLKSGAHYKIGRSEEIERRIKSIAVALPEAAELVHAIRTDDPPGIEAYWHRRFADRRANGEWFKLTSKDVAAFKKRKFQ